MRINNNISAMNVNRQAGINNLSQARNMERASSGQQINRAGDNPAGLAISERMLSQILGLNQASRNTQDAVSLLQVAEGGMQNIQDSLQRVRELAVQSASDTNQNLDRAALNLEASQLVEEIDQTAETTEFNETQLLSGALDPNSVSADGQQGNSLVIQVGANEGQTMEISIQDMSAQSLGVDEVDLTTAQTSQEAIGTVDNALNDVSMQRAEIGAMQNRLEFRMQNLDIQAENQAAAQSRIRDADMARTMTDLARNNILSQVNTAMQSHSNVAPQGVLQLLS
jgi:flagellin